MDALAQRSLVRDRLDVHDDVALRHRPKHGLLDRVRRSVALADGRVRGDPDYDVGEVLAAGLAHA